MCRPSAEGTPATHVHQATSRTAALIQGTGPAQRGALDAHLSAVQLHGSCPGPLGCCTTVSAHPPRGRRRELSLGLKQGLLLCAHGSCSGGSSAVGVDSRRFCWPGGSPPEACGGAGDEARARVHVQLGRSFPMLTRPVPGGTPLGQLGRSCPKPPLLTGAWLKGALTVVSQGLGPRAGASGRLGGCLNTPWGDLVGTSLGGGIQLEVGTSLHREGGHCLARLATLSCI